MVGGEDGGGGFSRGEEMPKIRARVAAADAASTIRIEWLFVLRVTGILDEHAAFAGIDARVARGACGQYTIHHVYAESDVICNLFRPAEAHQVARFLSRQQCSYFCRHFASDFVRLA